MHVHFRRAFLVARVVVIDNVVHVFSYSDCRSSKSSAEATLLYTGRGSEPSASCAEPRPRVISGSNKSFHKLAVFFLSRSFAAAGAVSSLGAVYAFGPSWPTSRASAAFSSVHLREPSLPSTNLYGLPSGPITSMPSVTCLWTSASTAAHHCLMRGTAR